MRNLELQMHKLLITGIGGLILLLLGGCLAPAQPAQYPIAMPTLEESSVPVKPTSVPVATGTSTPTPTTKTVTSIPPSPTSSMTATIPSSTPNLPIAPEVISTSEPDEAWQGLPLPPGAYTIADELENMLILDTTASLDEVEAFYQEKMAKEWILFEQLHSPQNRFGGEVFYLMFWRSELSAQPEQMSQVACILAGSDRTDTVAVTLSTECLMARTLADKLRTVPWTLPDTVTWTEPEADTFSLKVPMGWQEDAQFFGQPYCQTGSGIHCLAGYRYQDDSIFAQFSIATRPRPQDKALIDLAIESHQEVIDAYPQVGLILMQQIRLDDGMEAIQTTNTLVAADTPGILLSFYVVDDLNQYILQGTVSGQPERLFIMAEVLSAMARSLHLKGTS